MIICGVNNIETYLLLIGYASEHDAGLLVVGRGDEDVAENLGGAGHPDGAGWKLPK